jgi:hypothetical protein
LSTSRRVTDRLPGKALPDEVLGGSSIENVQPVVRLLHGALRDGPVGVDPSEVHATTAVVHERVPSSITTSYTAGSVDGIDTS